MAAILHIFDFVLQVSTILHLVLRQKKSSEVKNFHFLGMFWGNRKKQEEIA